MKIKENITILCYVIVLTSFAFSDRGLMPLNPDVQIFEPNQRAMIAWNGKEEILLLSTDLTASDSTMVLEVLPLHAEPEVKKGELETFRKAVDLINRKIYRAPGVKGPRLSEEAIPLPGEVTFHKKIGAHDISVTHLLNAQGFVDWVNDYLKSLGIEKDIISEAMKALIEKYIAENFKWFVFDVVTLSRETVTNQPIQYRFKTDYLFYPLKITSSGAGTTSIELMILTPRLLRNFPGLPINRVRLKHDPITITNEELKTISDDIYEILQAFNEMKLRIWKIEGELKSFDKDLIAK